MLVGLGDLLSLTKNGKDPANISQEKLELTATERARPSIYSQSVLLTPRFATSIYLLSGQETLTPRLIGKGSTRR
jgi:hypothetical protein